MLGGLHDFLFPAALIAVWAYGGFHRPYTTEAIRFATQRGPYRLAVCAYIAAILVLYVAVTLLVTRVTGLVSETWQSSEQSWFAAWLSNINALLAALVLVVTFPLTSAAHLLRRCAWLLAGFPKAAETVAATLIFVEDVQNHALLDPLHGELDHYDVGATDVGRNLSPRVQALLAELQSIHDNFERLIGKDAPAWLAQSQLRPFLRARSKVIERLDLEHARLIRRSARAIKFVVAQHIPQQDAYPLADLLGEEALRLLSDYRVLIAEALLSSVLPRDRAHFLQFFGYIGRKPAQVPVWPIAAVFALDAVMFLAFVGSMSLMSKLWPDLRSVPMPKLPIAALIAVGSLHGMGQAMAVAWAIYPKCVSNFSRPGIRSWPWQSYWCESNAWCPLRTAAMISSGSLVQRKGFGF